MALPKRGIDISEFNGSVDIAALQGQVDFVIIRCGYGSDYANQDDPQFEANVKKCQAAGIPWGTYLYSYAKTKAMAQSEAAHTLRLLQGRRPPYGVWYDVEDSSLPSGEAHRKRGGLLPGTRGRRAVLRVYASLSWWEGRLNSPRLDRFDKWVAQWNSQLDYQGPVGLWQFTDRLMLNGKAFDGNWAYRDYPALTGEEEDTMTHGSHRPGPGRAQKVYNENEAKYKTLASLPSWAKAPVEQVYRELGLAGTGGPGQNTQLDASETYIRALTVIAKVLEKLDPQPSPSPWRKFPPGVFGWEKLQIAR